MKKNSEIHFQQIKRKLIVIFIIFAIILLIMFALYYYAIIEQSKFEHLSKTTNVMKASSEMADIYETYQFYEKEGYHIFEGIDKNKDELFIFVPLETYKVVASWDFVYKKEIQSADKIRDKLITTCGRCNIKYITPGYIKDAPVWEVAFIDGKGDYILQYIEMNSGEQLEFLRFQRN